MRKFKKLLNKIVNKSTVRQLEKAKDYLDRLFVDRTAMECAKNSPWVRMLVKG